jgi:hypothetical protein
VTLDELMAPDAPAVVPFVDGARAIGFGRSAAYAAKREGRFPLPVIEAGHRWVVPTLALRRLLCGESSAPEVKDRALDSAALPDPSETADEQLAQA